MIVETPVRFYAVATNMDKVRRDPDLSAFEWILMKSKNHFSNMRQVHFNDKEKAVCLYDLIKSKEIIVFKNW